ncbi:related to actin-interacting protein AIP3 [Cephalotrichum gorgonifer]|uniref:Related to actin-interacting protein AIP3 n=1 Tax=Cephalotrichum gorgonifer TaxID=2041049 RepID=A0AAE8N140_9PEZI|nr:related to actin-interacting protein AIP3 [Cephalotrichum gorgonifer]
MQASGPPRVIQRRSPGAEPGPPPNIPIRSISPAPPNMQARGSGASGRSNQGGGGSTGSRKANAPNSSIPLSQIEKSVTHLLVATKQLLETLTQWSRGQATDGQVSDVYVRLGYEFNMACRAFSAINVDTSDLGNVPEMLRHILESTLSQEASQESLEKYLPRIRDIIISLLHGLKRKQQRLRQKQSKERENGGSSGSGGSGGGSGGSGGGGSGGGSGPIPIPERASSTATTASGASGLTTMLDAGIKDQYDDQQPSSQRKNRFPHRDDSRASANSGMSSISSNTMQNIPVLPPYPENGNGIEPPAPPAPEFNIDAFPPPPPPPKESSSQRALAALQKGGDLERRASRRYSQFQLARHLGTPSVPLLPTQNLPIPNRERGEIKESLRAVQVRETPLRHRRELSSQSKISLADSSPMRLPSRLSEEPSELPAAGSPPKQPAADDFAAPSATLFGPHGGPVPEEVEMVTPSEEKPPATQGAEKAGEPPKTRTPPQLKPETEGSYFQESPPPSPKELTLFLQYKSKVKKFVLPQGASELSIGRLQLAFIEKFSWNTQQNGVDLPEIYIQDPVSGVRHELEDLSDIQDRTVLVLNIEPLDEVKKHIDDGLGAIRQLVQEVKQNVSDQNTALLRVSERQEETAKEVALIASAPVAASPPADGSRPSAPSGGRKLGGGHLLEVQSIRRDLAVVRQTFSSFQADIQGAMSTIRAKAGSLKVAATNAAVPSMEGAEGYSYVIQGRKELNADSDRIVAKVDDLQDLVEDLRKDVVIRGVRPLPRQLETVNKDIVMLSKELKKMEDYMTREKPIWTKIWEKELEDVCQGRDELRLMEDLVVDLRDDLEKATETFSLVEQATKEQMRDNGTGASAGTARNFSRALGGGELGGNPQEAKEGVLGEVRALRPNHEDRLEAIERAEKLRQKELQTRGGTEMQRELEKFVGEGRLKKSGGFEEVERARRAKDEQARREVWERQNGVILDDGLGEDDEEEEEEEEEELEEGEEGLEAGRSGDEAAAVNGVS